MNEKKIGLIPRLWVQGKWGPQDWALFVTDQRTILVLEKSSKAGLGGAFGAVGVLVASAANSSRSFDYSQIDSNQLAADPKNMVIPHEKLLGIRLKKKMIGPSYEMELQYQGMDGRSHDFKGALLPPDIVVKNRKSQGEDKDQIFTDYTRTAMSLFQNALSGPRFQNMFSGPTV
ncbi:MAG TPA: hypothetical protein VFV92_06620 [Candidatus Bathyarchaeia archaeon]|nr:hypothetical protein [Candidatus Bathyarchaeia archaeon]